MIHSCEAKTALMPYGLDSGNTCLFLKFNCDRETLKTDWTKEDYTVWADHLIDSIRLQEPESLQKTLKFEDHFRCVIVGNGIEYIENKLFWDNFIKRFNEQALDLQKKIQVNKLHPPFITFAGLPQEHTGGRNVYESFNALAVHCPLYNKDEVEISKENQASFYKPFALIEMMNHIMGILIFPIKTIKQLKLIDIYLGDLKYPGDRIFVLCYDLEHITAIAKKVSKKGWRLITDINNILKKEDSPFYFLSENLFT